MADESSSALFLCVWCLHEACTTTTLAEECSPQRMPCLRNSASLPPGASQDCTRPAAVVRWLHSSRLPPNSAQGSPAWRAWHTPARWPGETACTLSMITGLMVQTHLRAARTAAACTQSVANGLMVQTQLKRPERTAAAHLGEVLLGQGCVRARKICRLLPVPQPLRQLLQHLQHMWIVQSDPGHLWCAGSVAV